MPTVTELKAEWGYVSQAQELNPDGERRIEDERGEGSTAGRREPRKPKDAAGNTPEKTPERQLGTAALPPSRTRSPPPAQGPTARAASPLGTVTSAPPLLRTSKKPARRDATTLPSRDTTGPAPKAYFRCPGARAWGVPLRQKGVWGARKFPLPASGRRSLQTRAQDRREHAQCGLYVDGVWSRPVKPFSWTVRERVSEIGAKSRDGPHRSSVGSPRKAEGR